MNSDKKKELREVTYQVQLMGMKKGKYDMWQEHWSFVYVTPRDDDNLHGEIYKRAASRKLSVVDYRSISDVKRVFYD